MVDLRQSARSGLCPFHVHVEQLVSAQPSEDGVRHGTSATFGTAVKLVGSLFLAYVLCGCASYTKRYYEPIGAGRLISPKYADPGPKTELQLDVKWLRSFGIRGIALERGARVCLLIVPEQSVAVAMGVSVVQRPRLPTGEPLLAVPNRVQVVFTPQEWNYPGSMPRSESLPLEIVGERIAADGFVWQRGAIPRRQRLL